MTALPGRCAALLLLASLAVACAPLAPRVQVEYPPGSDFSSYRSFAFAQPLALEQAGYPEAYAVAFRHQVSQGLVARGLEAAAEPDLWVDVAAELPAAGEARLVNDPYQAIHPPTGTFHGGWQGYGQGYGSSTQISRYADGTVRITLVDAATQQVVWRGSAAASRIGGQLSEQEIKDKAAQIVPLLLAELPPGTRP